MSSKLIYRSYKYRIYPNQEQEEFLNFNFGAVRFVWNQMVASFNHDVCGPVLPQNEKVIKEAYPFIKAAISYGIQQKRMDFDDFKTQYFSKTRKSKLGRPKFKKKSQSNDSFRVPGQKCNMSHINLESGHIKLPKMSKMKMVVDRKFTGTPKSVTVSKNKCNQYFVSILVQEEVELKQNTGRSIGIDLGFIDLCTLSDGTKIENPKLFRKNQAKLKAAQKHLSRKQKGSHRYEKQRLKVARIHLKISNQRSWFQHQISSHLVENYDVICMEDLNVSGMKKVFGKSASDAALSELVRQIEYKCEWYGKTFHKISRWYPSSKTCSSCGHKMKELSLDIRNLTCPTCNTEHDRDINAAKNILNEGLRELYSFTSDELADYKRREEVRPKIRSSEFKASSMKRLVKKSFT